MRSKYLKAGLLAAMLLGMSMPAFAHKFERNSLDNHPIRFLGYIAQPIGLAAEYVIFRPVHFFVSLDCLDIIFGHKSRLSDSDSFFEWTHGDHTMSISGERRQRRLMEAEAAK